MPSVGPSLPPELLEARLRKRKLVSDAATDNHEIQFPNNKNARIILSSRQSLISHDSLSPEGTAPHRDGCATVESTDEVEDDEDDNIGPVLPQESALEIRKLPAQYDSSDRQSDRRSKAAMTTSQVEQASRPDWMLKPPSSTDWTKSVDTTKLKSRTFATHRSRGKHIDDLSETTGSSKWTKLPGETTIASSSRENSEPRSNDHQARRHNDRQSKLATETQTNRGPSLYEQHNDKDRAMGRNDDEAVNRPFDREKDIGGNSSFTKTRQFAKNSKNLSSMFDTGKYL